MSAALLARQSRQRAPSSGSKGSSKGRSRSSSAVFTPCTATASLLLYAQGSTILCLHHDTLALDRRFTKHTADVSLISVDNVSERGAGRLVVSYDVSQAAIVWDLFSGNQVSHFASFEPMRVAAWMRNGNVAFGKLKATQSSRSLELTSTQVIPKARLSSLSHLHPNMCARRRFTTQLLHLRRCQTAGHMR